MEIKDNNLELVIKKNNIILLDFYAVWCGPCSTYGPTFEKFGIDNPEIGTYKVNVDDNSDLVAKYGVRSIPSTVVLKGGQLVTKVQGNLTSKNLSELIKDL